MVRKPPTRRELVTTGIAGMGALAAGCLGGDDGGDGDGGTGDGSDGDGGTGDGGDTGGTGDGYSPPRNIVEVWAAQSPSDFQHLIAQFWMSIADNKGYFGEDITTTVSTISDRIAAGNNLNSLDGTEGSGTMLLERASSLIIPEITDPDLANYSTGDFRVPAISHPVARGIQMNPDTMPVEDHFDITWDEFIEYSQDNDVVFGTSGNPMHTTLIRIMEQLEPRLEEGDWTVVEFDGGGGVRNAMARGEADVYQGSYTGQFLNNNEFYYTQFCIIDDRYSNLLEKYGSLEPQEGDVPEDTLGENLDKTLGNTSFPDEASRAIVDLTVDNWTFFMSPNVSDEDYQFVADAMQQTGEDPDTLDAVSATYTEVEHVPEYGDTAEQITQEKYTSITDPDGDLRPMIEELF